MKSKTVFVCQSCGAHFPKWAGKCESCGEWNTLQEEMLFESPKSLGNKISSAPKKPSIPLSKSEHPESFRIQTGISEFDRVLGGGFFHDSLVLLTGDPGIGKSTISLQVALQVAQKTPEKTVLIVSGEESLSQISDRIHRLSSVVPPNLKILSDTLLENALSLAASENIALLVFDSVQTLSSGEIPSSPGSINQIRGVTEALMKFAKQNGVPTLLIGHVTKSGDMAGPQVLAHLVDVVLYFEGERFHEFRILRSTKNRFGSAFEVGVFEMAGEGLREVLNPSESFLSGRLQNALGSVIFPAMEGTRPFLVEAQALTSFSSFGYPKRSASGYDATRLSILIAILERHAGVRLDSADVYVNIVGGLKITEPAADLPIACAILSSKLQKPILEKSVFCGELGLSGEVRAVPHLERRILEAEKLGFTTAIVPHQKSLPKTKSIRIEVVQTISEVKKKFFS
jgi:DNA repair protein RadA/Sms